MNQFQRCLGLQSLCLLVVSTLGCGGDVAPPTVDVDQMANAKVAAINRVAEGMAKEPSGTDARAALEDFRNHTLDMAKHEKQAQEIVDIYKQKIKGKFQGEVAQELQMEIASIEAALKQSR